MDKLEPVLAQKFWIIAAVALILPSYGWWTASDTLRSEAQTRVQKLDGDFGRIPGEGQIKEIPNKDWTAKVEEQNTVREQQNKQAAAVLWQAQKELMFWPDNIAADMAASGYRGELPEGRDVARHFYRTEYPLQISKLRSIVNPISPTNPDGVVQLAQDTLTQVPAGRWDRLAPTVEEMWDAQEDIWLQTALLNAIAEVNKDATSIADAPIRFIQKLELRGGDRASANAGPAARTNKQRGGGQRPKGYGLRGMGGTGRNRRGDVAATAINVEFNPASEFGTPPQGSPVDNVGAGTVRATRITGPDDDDDDPARFNRGGQEEEGPRVVRYVDDGTKTPYKTRAFYMKVIMDDREIPALLTELTNSPWPIEIVRVHRVSLWESQEADKLRNKVRLSSRNVGNNQNLANTVQERVATALKNDRWHLSTVVVGGLMTLYNPVEPPKAKSGQARPAENQADAQPAADAPADTDSADSAAGSDQPAAESETESEDTSQPANESTTDVGTSPAAGEPEETSSSESEPPPPGERP